MAEAFGRKKRKGLFEMRIWSQANRWMHKLQPVLIIYWSEENESFIVEVPKLPGCMADGKTYQEAVTNVEVVIQEWIKMAQALGRSIPLSKGRLNYV